jgi:glycosyltransferase involved in cell wall biosynthesis
VPLISICLPIFNGEKYLSAAIASILAQTLNDFELLVADDGSTDGSAEICERFAKADNRIRYWRNDTRLGLFGNYNCCIKRSTGELIKTFAQDDLLEPACLEKLSDALLTKPEIALVSSARQVIDESGQCTFVRKPFPRSMTIPAREVLTFNLINLNNWVGEPSTVMFRKKDAGSGFDESYYHYGDIEYWFRILENGNYYFVDDVLCSFRRHIDSQTDKNHRELYFALDILRLTLSYRHVLADIEPDDLFRRRISETVALQLGYTADRHGEGLTKHYEETFLSAKDSDQLSSAAAGFRLLSSYALGSLTELMSELDHEKRCRFDEHERFAGEVEKMRNSLYWKLTSPLRAVRDTFKNE